MKEIVNGRMFNTVNAIFVGSDGYSCSSDFQYWREELYQKRNGEFFLYGEGGPGSKYREPVDVNCWRGSSDIIPLTFQSAREWAEEHLGPNTYQDIFGPIEEDDSKIMVNFYIESSTWEMAKQAAHSKGLSITDYMDAIIKTANKR